MSRLKLNELFILRSVSKQRARLGLWATLEQLTRLESDFADEHPRRVEEQLDADEASDEVGQKDDDVTREVDEVVASVLVDHRLDGRRRRAHDVWRSVAHSDNGASKHSDVPCEHVVAVKSNSDETARPLELELDYDRVRFQTDAVGGRRPRAVVPPPDPLVPLPAPAVRVQP